MASRSKGQVAFEYMMVVSLVVLFLIPVWAYMSTVQQEASNDLYFAYAKSTARKVVDTAELVYSQGEPASVNIIVYIPKYVESIDIINETVTFHMNTGVESTVFAIGLAELNGTLPTIEGNYVIHIEAVDDYVQIDPVY